MVAYAKFVFPAAGPFFGTPNSNGAFPANAIDTTPLTQVQNEFDVRGDQTFGAKDSAWFRYSFINSTVNSIGRSSQSAYASSYPSPQLGRQLRPYLQPHIRLCRGNFRTPRSRTTQTTRFTASTADIISAVGFSTAFASGFAGLNGGSLLASPGIERRLANGGESIDDTPKATDSYEYRGTYTHIMGNHEVKFGLGWDTANFASPLSQISLNFTAPQTAAPQLPNVATGDPLIFLSPERSLRCESPQRG